MKKSIKILSKYYSDEQIMKILAMWNSPERYWHDINHLHFLFDKIEAMNEISQKSKEILTITAFFHDAIYNPKRKDNEEQSIKLFKEYSRNLYDKYYHKIIEIITCTSKYPDIPTNKLSKIFWKIDNDPVINGDFESFKKYEKLIRMEYSFVSIPDYKNGRIHFLSKYIGILNKEIDNFIIQCINYISIKYD